MGLFNKKADPLSERSRELKGEIAALEAKIKKLSTQAERVPTPGLAKSIATEPPPALVADQPIFENTEKPKLASAAEPLIKPEHYNEHGVRKFDLPSLFRRFHSFTQPPSANNPKLFTYLAAGSVQGLRPLRYEKRVARNRFIVLAGIFMLILWGLAAIFLRR